MFGPAAATAAAAACAVCAAARGAGRLGMSPTGLCDAGARTVPAVSACPCIALVCGAAGAGSSRALGSGCHFLVCPAQLSGTPCLQVQVDFILAVHPEAQAWGPACSTCQDACLPVCSTCQDVCLPVCLTCQDACLP